MPTSARATITHILNIFKYAMEQMTPAIRGLMNVSVALILMDVAVLTIFILVVIMNMFTKRIPARIVAVCVELLVVLVMVLPSGAKMA